MRRITPRRIVFGAWIVFVLFGYPGYMRADAVNELADSRVGDFTDWQSPVLTELWRILGRVFAGPAPLYLLQGGLLVVGTFALARLVVAERKAAWIAAAVLLFPPLIATTSLISDDATLAGLLACGAALMLTHHQRSGLVVLAIAASLRSGALVAVVPILAATLQWPGPRWRRVGVVIAACVAMAGMSFVLDLVLVDLESRRPEVALAMEDIVGTLEHAPPLDDATVQREAPGVYFAHEEDIQSHAKQAYGHRPYDHGPKRMFDYADTDRAKTAVLDARTQLSFAHPLAYLKHRGHVFVRVLGFVRGKRWRPFHTEFVQNPNERYTLAHDARHSSIQRALIWPVRKLSHSILFRVYVYAFIALVILGIALVRRHAIAALLAASGIAYELALGIVTAEPDYRHSHWMMVTSVLATLLVIVRELEARNESVLDETSRGVAHDDGV